MNWNYEIIIDVNNVNICGISETKKVDVSTTKELSSKNYTVVTTVEVLIKL